MNNKTILFALMLTLFAGCFGQAPSEKYPAPPVTTQMVENAADFTGALANCPIRAAVLNNETLQMYDDNLAPLFERLRILSFNRIIIDVASIDELNNWIPVAEYAANCNIKTQLLLRESNFTKRSGNHGEFVEMAKKVKSFNSSLSSDAKLAGAIFFIEIHLFTHGNPDKPADLLYAWNENNYGPGGDNNMLLNYALEQMKTIKKNLTTIPLTVGIPDFYLFAAESGKLDREKLTAILELGEGNFFDISGNLPGDIAENFSSAQSFARKPMTASIKFASHIAENSGVLRKRNWADLVNSMKFIFDHNKLAPNFQGMALGPFVSVEDVFSQP